MGSSVRCSEEVTDEWLVDDETSSIDTRMVEMSVESPIAVHVLFHRRSYSISLIS